MDLLPFTDHTLSVAFAIVIGFVIGYFTRTNHQMESIIAQLQAIHSQNQVTLPIIQGLPAKIDAIKALIGSGPSQELTDAVNALADDASQLSSAVSAADADAVPPQ